MSKASKGSKGSKSSKSSSNVKVKNSQENELAPPVDENSMTIEYSCDQITNNTQPEISEDIEYEEDEGENITLPTSEKAREFCLKMLDEMQPVDSDDPSGENPCGFMMLGDSHGYAAIKVMENKLKMINKPIREANWVEAYDMIDAFTIAIQIQDHWTQVDDGEYVVKLAGKIAKTYEKIVKGLAKAQSGLSNERKEEIKASIEKICAYGENLEQYGIDTFSLKQDKLTKLFN